MKNEDKLFGWKYWKSVGKCFSGGNLKNPISLQKVA